jgi:hypothetical protein
MIALFSMCVLYFFICTIVMNTGCEGICILECYPCSVMIIYQIYGIITHTGLQNLICVEFI